MKLSLKYFFCGLAIAAFFLFGSRSVSAAVLSISPTSGTFEVGSTFEISLFLNTQGQEINAVHVAFKFPADKLQLVSPAASRSIIEIWTSQPKFNNRTGSVELQGVIPGGLNVSKGLITSLTFRARAVGSAIVRFLDDSKVLLNDGLGTDVLTESSSGVFKLILPPPQGPIVASETHPEQSKWYASQNIILRWAEASKVDGYSYVLNQEPTDRPDDISEGIKDSVSYKDVGDGVHYFHVQALRDGVWGGATHFAVNVDATPPAEFPIKVIPGRRTVRRQPVLEFSTTDRVSGIDHYELKVVPLRPLSQTREFADQPLFFEVTSPYIMPELELGTYDVIVRVYDRAGNYREAVEKIAIVSALFKIVGDRGLEIKGFLNVTWFWLFVITALLIGILGYVAWHIRLWHHTLEGQQAEKKLPVHLKERLEILKKYLSKYRKTLIIFIMAAVSISLTFKTYAQQIELEPPLITTIAKNISNEEIFYAGGKTVLPNTQIIIYVQNLGSGETISFGLEADKRGDWFYRHHTFLSTGDYLLWAQSKIGGEFSPPSPQVNIRVRATAIQIGASRLSYETLYLILLIIFVLMTIGLIIFIALHFTQASNKRRRFKEEVDKAEASIHRGFAVLRRDIQAELAVIRKVKLAKALSAEEKFREQQLLKDLEEVESYLGREIWEFEKAEHIG